MNKQMKQQWIDEWVNEMNGWKEGRGGRGEEGRRGGKETKIIAKGSILKKRCCWVVTEGRI